MSKKLQIKSLKFGGANKDKNAVIVFDHGTFRTILMDSSLEKDILKLLTNGSTIHNLSIALIDDSSSAVYCNILAAIVKLNIKFNEFSLEIYDTTCLLTSYTEILKATSVYNLSLKLFDKLIDASQLDLLKKSISELENIKHYSIDITNVQLSDSSCIFSLLDTKYPIKSIRLSNCTLDEKFSKCLASYAQESICLEILHLKYPTSIPIQTKDKILSSIITSPNLKTLTINEKLNFDENELMNIFTNSKLLKLNHNRTAVAKLLQQNSTVVETEIVTVNDKFIKPIFEKLYLKLYNDHNAQLPHKIKIPMNFAALPTNEKKLSKELEKFENFFSHETQQKQYTLSLNSDIVACQNEIPNDIVFIIGHYCFLMEALL